MSSESSDDDDDGSVHCFADNTTATATWNSYVDALQRQLQNFSVLEINAANGDVNDEIQPAHNSAWNAVDDETGVDGDNPTSFGDSKTWNEEDNLAGESVCSIRNVFSLSSYREVFRSYDSLASFRFMFLSISYFFLFHASSISWFMRLLGFFPFHVSFYFILLLVSCFLYFMVHALAWLLSVSCFFLFHTSSCFMLA
jgi:hypothetical protein